MKGYRLNKEKFANFVAGVIDVLGLIAVFVWFLTHMYW